MDPAMNLELVRHLAAAHDEWISLEALSHKFDASALAVERDIDALVAAGYGIQSHRALGLRLDSFPQRLPADAVSSVFRDHTIGRVIRCHEVVSSTNDAAWDVARDNFIEGYVVLAEEQTRARGRFGRSWASPRGGGLWLSVVLREPQFADGLSLLAAAAALAVVDAIRDELMLSAQIRWPNDIVIGGRKVAGILAEAHAQQGPVRPVVLGIGVNVNLDPAQLPAPAKDEAGSLRAECGAEVDRVSLLCRLLTRLDAGYAEAREQRVAGLTRRWRESSSLLGRLVAVHTRMFLYEGTVIDVHPVKGITLRLPDGVATRVRAEDVIRIRPGSVADRMGQLCLAGSG